ncbi:hypothetical protein [Desulfosediminicola flagellatus]|uniref:hypothetical protein n=1 Tax=Desulfosediminicola flagellatus TaxID=2569541 RepID=UPI0010ACF846|nr:hypothetical protein [Desulfosediminicola flagellatus]
MEKGDIVIANQADSRSRDFVRSYGIVQEMTKSGNVIIKMADGSVIKRQFNSIAVYIQPPSNWQELFEQQQVVCSQPKQKMMVRNTSKHKQQN